MGDQERQRQFIAGSMNTIGADAEKVRTRRNNQAFHLFKSDRTVRVCNTFFMNTLDITPRVIRTVIEKSLKPTNIIEKDLRGKHENHKRLNSTREKIHQFINDIPKIPSHYCRSESKKEFIVTSGTKRKQSGE